MRGAFCGGLLLGRAATQCDYGSGDVSAVGRRRDIYQPGAALLDPPRAGAAQGAE